MNETDFLNFTTNTQIATALTLIVVLLLYIAFKVTDNKKRSHRSSK